MNYVIISTSLNPKSNGRILAKEMEKRLVAQNHKVTFIDIQDYNLPICSGKSCDSHKEVQKIMPIIEKADGILFAAPIYNYNVAASSKNFLELTGKAWSQKVVGILAAAGGDMSYLAPMPIITSLMIDYRCYLVPRYVYATGKAFNEEQTQVTNEKVHERLDGLAEEFIMLSEALKGKV